MLSPPEIVVSLRAAKNSPLVLSLFLGEHLLQRLDAHLDHGVVRLKGSPALNGHAGPPNGAAEEIVVSSHIAVEFPGKSHHHGQEGKMDQRPQPRVGELPK